MRAGAAQAVVEEEGVAGALHLKTAREVGVEEEDPRS